MANYNTFAVMESKHGKTLLITSSARKALELLCVGRRIEIWNANKKCLSITFKFRDQMQQFIQLEKEYIRNKQENATARNKRKIRLKNKN